MLRLGRYRGPAHIFIDNVISPHRTLDVLRRLAARDRNVKVIENTRNFGHIRSPIHALHQASGDAVNLHFVYFQDLLGASGGVMKLQLGKGDAHRKSRSRKPADENAVMFWLRKKYYQMIRRMA